LRPSIGRTSPQTHVQDCAKSWKPENRAQSTVQIWHDPGWLLKWIGSLLVVIGVFMMLYFQPYRKQTEGERIPPLPPKA
jgi:hypothetical protein